MAAAGNAPPEDEKIQLSDEQEKVLRMVHSGQNIFFTGPAGTGKSVLLRAIIKDVRERYIPSHVAVTASTGMAGKNVGGTTLHSFAGVGLAKDNVHQLVESMGKFSKDRWQRTEVLVIDEISMVDGAFFDKLEEIARRVRKNPAPFGGIQLVICGDFFQLPPVGEKNLEGETIPTFAFEAKSWRRCIPRPVFLTKVFRQKDDEFVRILTNLRNGVLTQIDTRALERLSRPLTYTDGIDPIEIFPVKKQVDACNSKKLSTLPLPQHVYMAIDSVGYDVYGAPLEPDNARTALDRLIAPPFLSLRLGAQVMLIQNCTIDQGEETELRMVNGSLGKVVDFLTREEAYAQQKADPPRPLKIMPALPRSSSKSSMPSPRPLNGHQFSQRQVWPVVQFENEQELLCPASIFTVEGFPGNTEAMRAQVPLILAWAISVHKSQGQTLNRAKVDLGRTFETGQAYVAISRVTSMKGLELANFHPSKIKAHPRVVSWSRSWAFASEDDSELEDSDLENIE